MDIFDGYIYTCLVDWLDLFARLNRVKHNNYSRWWNISPQRSNFACPEFTRINHAILHNQCHGIKLKILNQSVNK